MDDDGEETTNKGIEGEEREGARAYLANLVQYSGSSRVASFSVKSKRRGG